MQDQEINVYVRMIKLGNRVCMPRYTLLSILFILKVPEELIDQEHTTTILGSCLLMLYMVGVGLYRKWLLFCARLRKIKTLLYK